MVGLQRWPEGGYGERHEGDGGLVAEVGSFGYLTMLYEMTA